MSESVKIALIAATPPTIIALISWISHRKAIMDVHVQLNSRLDQLLLAREANAHNKGMEAQRKLDKPKP